jgi:hypothetical protein
MAKMRRRDLLSEIIRGPASKAVGAVVTLLGLIATVREIALPEPAQAKLNFYRIWSLDWPWWLWTIVLLSAALMILFEGAYRAIRKREQEMAALAAQIAQLTAVRPLLIAEFLQEPMNGSDSYSKGIFGAASPNANRTSDIIRITNIGDATATNVTIDLGEKLPTKWCIHDKEIPILMPSQSFETRAFVSQLVHSMARQVGADELRLPVNIRYDSYRNGNRTPWLTVCAIVLNRWTVTMGVLGETDTHEWTPLPPDLDVIGYE